MHNKAKIQAFIRSLSDQEINSQISDLFTFMEEYKTLLLEEQKIRHHSSVHNDVILQELQEEHPVTMDPDDQENSAEESILSFQVINAIHEKVARFSVDELLDNMIELDEILDHGPHAMQPEAFE